MNRNSFIQLEFLCQVETLIYRYWKDLKIYDY